MTPIFIASKGRANNSNILTELNEKKANFYIFIEPQELHTYSHAYQNANIINIQANNKGLPYVRQFMLNYANENNLPLYWNLDDDVTLYRVENAKCIKTGYEVLYEAEKYFKDDDTIAQAGLEYRQFAWSQTKPFTLNSYCDCVVAIKPYLCKDLVFDNDVLLKLDRDFTMQVINSGYTAMKINSFCFSSPKNGSNKGGLFDVYQSNVEKTNSDAMEAKWGEYVCKSFTKPDGRNDVKIYWKNIGKQTPLTLF